MTKSSTTHALEIETGIGEPAFIPLTLGHELQPISIGKKGMWRIESAGVLDLHAFVYFDGATLFLQGTEDSAALSVEGYRIGKAWTELRAPCTIEIGTARLRYRSLVSEAQARPRSTARASDSSRTERPFRPGEFTAPMRGEATRVAPLDPGTPRGPTVLPSSQMLDVPPPPSAGHRAVPMLPGMPIPEAIGGPNPYASFASGPNSYEEVPQSSMLTTGGFGSVVGGQTGGGAYRSKPSYVVRWNGLRPMQRLLVVLAPFCLFASGYLLLVEEPKHPASRGNSDAGFATQPHRAATAPTATATVAATAPTATAPMATSQSAGIAEALPSAATPTIASAGLETSTTKTLERQAVDAVAANDYVRAASIYDRLRQLNPANPAYLEAARILRAKTDAGAPVPPR